MISPRRILFLSLVSFAIAGCGQTYSPFLTLPKEPLHANQVEIEGSLAMLPQLGIYTGHSGAIGGATGVIRYGVTDRFTLQGSSWTSNQNAAPEGFSIGGIEMFSDRDSKWQFGLIPTVAVLNNGLELQGWGASMTLAAWMPEFLGVRPYAGIGALAGAADVRPLRLIASDSAGHFYGTTVTDYRPGFGGMLNLGITGEVFDHLELSAELASPVIYDSYTHGTQWWIVPSLTAGYRF